MNRPIKFRVWDKLNKKMIVDEDNLLISLSGDVVKVWDDGEWANTINGLNYILMQYTGLKDKNGKECYEGDVVVLPDSEITPITDEGQGPEEDMNHLSPVEFKGGCFGLNVLEDSGIFHKGFWSFDSILNGNGYKLEDLEVIGNIHENSELIK